jgi:hypothetical protein
LNKLKEPGLHLNNAGLTPSKKGVAPHIPQKNKFIRVDGAGVRNVSFLSMISDSSPFSNNNLRYRKK